MRLGPRPHPANVQLQPFVLAQSLCQSTPLHSHSNCCASISHSTSPGRGQRKVPCCRRRTRSVMLARTLRSWPSGTRCIGWLVSAIQGAGRQPPATGRRSARSRSTPSASPIGCRQTPRRFIPACAGNTWYRPGRGCSRPVHPRVCGEHNHEGAHLEHVVGSSPRVRGTLNHASNCYCSRRFIPACAGNTARPGQ